MTQNNNHVTTALGYAESARAMADHLDDLPEDEANTYAARRMRNEVNTAVRLAGVYANLAVAEALRAPIPLSEPSITYLTGEPV